MTIHVVLFHGIEFRLKPCWGEALRLNCGVPATRWHPMLYDDLLSQGSERTSGLPFQRLLWSLIGDVKNYWQPTEDGSPTICDQVTRRCLGEIMAIAPPAELVLVGHSWGTRVMYDTLRLLERTVHPCEYACRRIVYMGAALGDNPPARLFQTTHGSFNLRGRAMWDPWGLLSDPVSLPLDTCDPPPFEETVRALHSTLWRCRRLVELVREAAHQHVG